MKLNKEEKEKLINSLKEQYETSKRMFENDELYWLTDSRSRNKFIADNEKLREQYEALEKEDEIDVPLYNQNGDVHLGGALGLIAFLAIFGGFNSNNLPTPDDTTLN